ncbi:hypothetical protein [Sorangium sp. So ce1099]|uniref:hypothetical protein n=1 Tax=Sorangium sp. So ce1099 TaxID=3133331 RepID=UPI003F637FFC
MQISNTVDVVLTVEPASPGDTGAADGVSTISDMGFSAWGPTAMLVKSNTVVEFARGYLHASYGFAGRHGKKWPGANREADGAHGMYGGDVRRDRVLGRDRARRVAVVNPCEGGLPSVGGKGGDGLPGGAEDGHDGEPVPVPNPTYLGSGGDGDAPDVGCKRGAGGRHGAHGTVGAAGEGIGRISEAGLAAIDRGPSSCAAHLRSMSSSAQLARGG